MIVGSLFSSPRRRRRLVWCAGVGALAVAVGLAVKAMPGGEELPPDTFSNQQAVDVLANEKLVKITAWFRIA